MRSKFIFVSIVANKNLDLPVLARFFLLMKTQAGKNCGYIHASHTSRLIKWQEMNFPCDMFIVYYG